MCELYDLNLTLEKPEDFILPSSQEEEVQLEEVTDVLHNIEEIAELPEEETEGLKEDVDGDNGKDAETLQDDDDEHHGLETDFEMKEVEEELMNEEGIQIAPAFELDTVEKTTDVELEDDGLQITYNDEEDDDDDDENDTNIENNKRWTKRTHQTLRTVQKGLKKKQPIHFTDLTMKSNRKQAAYTFYTLLILSKEQALDVQQSELFGDITIDRGAKYTSHV